MPSFGIIILFYAINTATISTSASTTCTIPKHLDDINSEYQILTNILTNYTKGSTPPGNGTEVQVELLINDITSLSEINSELLIDVYFSAQWHDSRLSYSHFPTCRRNMTLHSDFHNSFWQPNVCIVNTVSVKVHESPMLNIFSILYQTGTLKNNARMRVKIPCTIDMRRYPFDSQRCHLIIESYTYNNKKVKLRWANQTVHSNKSQMKYTKKQKQAVQKLKKIKLNPLKITSGVILLKPVNLPDFTLSNLTQSSAQFSYPNGEWDQLQLDFEFDRRFQYFILQAYVPTFLTITAAYINFWIDSRDTETRATLTVSAVLALSMQYDNMLSNQPPVSYLTAIDVWMLASMTFLFFALSELVIISCLRRKINRRNEHSLLNEERSQLHTFLSSEPMLVPQYQQQKDDEFENSIGNWLLPRPETEQQPDYDDNQVKNNIRPRPVDTEITHSNATKVKITLEHRKKSRSNLDKNLQQLQTWFDNATLEYLHPYNIDMMCILGFPPLFVVFNIIYWYLYASPP